MDAVDKSLESRMYRFSFSFPIAIFTFTRFIFGISAEMEKNLKLIEANRPAVRPLLQSLAVVTDGGKELEKNKNSSLLGNSESDKLS